MDEEDDELAELEEKLKTAQLPDHALKVARKELKVNLKCVYTCFYDYIGMRCVYYYIYIFTAYKKLL